MRSDGFPFRRPTPVRVVCPELKIPERIWKRLRAFIAACPGEVGGLGTVEIVDGDLAVTDVFLLEQTVSAASTELDPAAVARFVTDWATAGKDVSLLRFWWHSHATFEVGWSATDLSTIALLAQGGFLVSYVGNHRGDELVRLTLHEPVRLSIDDLPLTVVPRLDVRLMAAVRAEVKAKVRPKPWWRRRPPAGDPPKETPAIPALLEPGNDGHEGGGQS